MTRRPKRKKVPKYIVVICALNQNYKCFCGCGECLNENYPEVTIDHDPPLGERPVNDDGSDYIPPQRDPRHLRIYIRGHDGNKTYGSGGTTRIETRSGDLGRMAHGKRTKAKHEQHLAVMKAKHGQ